MQLLWWHWIIAGFCLIGFVLIVPSFTIIWCGMGALAIGVITLLWPDFPLAGQVLLWMLASICFTVMWFKYLKPRNNNAEKFRWKP
jgi:inner membrane protein